MGEQSGFIGEPHREVSQDVDPAVARGMPLHMCGPSGHPGEVGLQVRDAGIVVDAQPAERLGDRIVGAVHGATDVAAHLPGQRSVSAGQRQPRRVEAVLTARHRPGGAAEEGRAPLRGLRVDGVGDRGGALLGAGQEAAPGLRAGGTVQQIRPQQGQWADGAPADAKVGLVGQVGEPARQHPVQVTVGDPALPVQPPELRLPQRSGHPVQVTGPPDRLLEGKPLQPGQRVDRDEGLQRVVRRHHPGGQGDGGAQLGPPGVPDGHVDRHERTPVSCAGVGCAGVGCAGVEAAVPNWTGDTGWRAGGRPALIALA